MRIEEGRMQMNIPHIISKLWAAMYFLVVLARIYVE